jgi:hypothetical protein
MSVPAEGEFATPLETYTHRGPAGYAALGWLDGWMGCRSLGVTTHLVIRSRSDATCTSNLLCRQQTFCPLRPTKGKVVARLLLPSALFAHIVFAHPLDVANSPNRVSLTRTLISNTKKNINLKF